MLTFLYRYKSIFSLLFTGIFLYNVLGYYPLFLLKEYKIEQEFKKDLSQHLNTKDFTVIKIDKNSYEVKWDGDDELWYKGNLYDVVAKNKVGTSLEVYCINDKQETCLYEKLNQHVKSNTNESSSSDNSSKSNVKSMVDDCVVLTTAFNFSIIEIKINSFSKNTCNLLSAYADVVTSPPDLLV